MLEKLTFEIQESPVLYDVQGQILTSGSHKVISRNDNNSVISVMKNSYNPMLNADFMESTERMKEISGFEIAGYSEIDGGRIILSHLKNNLTDFEIGGHKIDDYLLLGSSFDGRYPFFIGTTTVLIRCQNQFSKISRVEKVRHTKSAPKKREELMQSLEAYFTNRKAMYENFEKMRQYEVDDTVKKLAIDYILNVSKEDKLDTEISTRKMNKMLLLDSNMISEMNDLGNNLWSLFNGVTKYTTHELTQKESVFGNMFGNAALLNNRAYEFATNLVENF
jgi:hypothetical protein